MILDGKAVADKIYENLKQEIGKRKVKPVLAVILVGEDPASLSYVKVKEKKAKELGIGFRLYHFPEIARQDEIGKLLSDLNKNKYVGGIMIQLPLPKKLDTESLIGKISLEKDIDGLAGVNPTATALAILEILKYYKIPLEGKKITLVGQGKLVGGPLKKIFSEQKLDLTVCNYFTKNLKEKTLTADILISAVGHPGLIKKGMVKKGAVVIDAGTSEIGGKIKGDIDEKVYQESVSYTPSPGGVGPVTVACLMKNLVEVNNS